MSETPNTRGPSGSWKSVRTARASQEIVDQIRSAFFEGLKPGDWLGTESELAESFGVSRITVRDAIRALEANGIVEVKVGANGGVRIASGDPDRFADALAIQLQLVGVTWDELLEAQIAIERMTAERAAIRSSEVDLADLAELLDESERVVGDPNAFTEVSIRFHRRIAEAAGNRALLASVRALSQVQVVEYTPHTSKDVATGVIRVHRDIYGAIADRDPEKARSLMGEHLHLVNERAGTRRVDPGEAGSGTQDA